MPNTLFDQEQSFLKKFLNKFKSDKVKIFLKYFLYGAFLILFLTAANLSAAIFNLKLAYERAVEGIENLENAVYFAVQENFPSSSAFSRVAGEKFYSAKEYLDKAGGNFFISKIQFLKVQTDSAGHLLGAARILSSAAGTGAKLGLDLENLLEENRKLSFSKFTVPEKKRILEFIGSSAAPFEQIKNCLDEAESELNNVEYAGFLNSFKDETENLKTKISAGRELVAKALPMVKVLPAVFGYPKKMNYLIALQNSDELRPTGGFLGTYSIMEIEYGEILNCMTEDIYHLDMPVKDVFTVEPPAPLKKYLAAEKWFMRDANWSPDWQESAEKIEWFYKNELALLQPQVDVSPKAALAKSDVKKNKVLGETVKKENALEIAGVIGITPKIITDLLSITGPVYVEEVKYDKDNFVDLLQYRVEKGYIELGIPSWQRKDVISEIYKELKIKLFDLPPERWKDVINAIDANLKEKNILISLKNKAAQNLIREQGYGGEIKQTDGDYFFVVDANLASFKTDGVMEKKISYKMDEEGGKMIAKLRIDYKNTGEFSWKTTRYRTYTRVYVPEGAKLIKTYGALGDAETYNELGKTCFAAFITIEPGKIGSLYFEYELPARILDNGNYKLYIQKQPGNVVGEMSAELNFSRDVKFSSPSACLASGCSLTWTGDLREDREIEAGF